jgi:hypothetical protein
VGDVENNRDLIALLVGVGEYDPQSGVRSLRGCANDVRAVAQMLTREFGVPTENLVTLVDGAAKRQAILNAFREHLIGKALAWKAAHPDSSVQDGPVILFYFSGHGSQARDLSGVEPDGMDETLVAHDSRTPGVFDIRDWELGQLLKELRAVTEHVGVILDCCHAGSGTRDVDERGLELPAVRACPPDLRTPDVVRPVAGRGVAAVEPSETLGHVLLAACRDFELAREQETPDGDATQWRGALTYALEQVLLAGGKELMWAELYERVRTRVQEVYERQTPQCEGDGNRSFLGGAAVSREKLFSVASEQAGLLWVDGGVVHGIRLGCRLAVWDQSVRTRAEAGAPVATLEVVEEGAHRSGCRIVEKGRRFSLPARAAVVSLGGGNARRAVRLAIDDSKARAELMAYLVRKDGEEPTIASPYVRIVERMEELRIVQSDVGLTICDRGGDPLAGPYALDDLEALGGDLAHVIRWRNVRDLRNEMTGNPLSDAVGLRVCRLVVDVATGKPRSEVIEVDALGELAVEDGALLVFEIANRTSKPLYVGLLSLTVEQEVYLVWPHVAGAREAVFPGRTFSIGLSERRSEQLQATVVDGGVESRDLYKLIASTEDVDFSLLAQGALGTPYEVKKAVGMENAGPAGLEGHFAAITGAAGSRASSGEGGGNWLTVEKQVTVWARSEKAAKFLVGGGSVELEPFAVTVEAPQGFVGRVRVVTEGQAMREAGPGNAVSPAGLVQLPYALRRGPGGAGGLLGASGAWIEVESDELSRGVVANGSPLWIRVRGTTAGQPLKVMSWDGDKLVEVGRAQAGVNGVAVNRLPLAGGGRSVRLYLCETE